MEIPEKLQTSPSSGFHTAPRRTRGGEHCWGVTQILSTRAHPPGPAPSREDVDPPSNEPMTVNVRPSSEVCVSSTPRVVPFCSRATRTVAPYPRSPTWARFSAANSAIGRGSLFAPPIGPKASESLQRRSSHAVVSVVDRSPTMEFRSDFEGTAVEKVASGRGAPPLTSLPPSKRAFCSNGPESHRPSSGSRTSRSAPMPTSGTGAKVAPSSVEARRR